MAVRKDGFDMKRIFFVIVVLILMSLACNMNMGKSSGGEVRMDDAGFSVEVPEGYQMSSVLGELSITQQGADLFEGPHFSVSVGPAELDTDPGAILENIEGPNNVLGYVYGGNPTSVMVGDMEGLAEDFTGTTDERGVAIAGRVVVAVLPDGRVLRFFGNWPADRQDQAEPVFTSILNSVQFYDPIQTTSN
jgi:hypothetical protein